MKMRLIRSKRRKREERREISDKESRHKIRRRGMRDWDRRERIIKSQREENRDEKLEQSKYFLKRENKRSSDNGNQKQEVKGDKKLRGQQKKEGEGERRKTE